ncbi:MAG: hypothetical protein AB1650_05740 [Candidatus Omnitrophota bacterium]
MKGKLLLFAVLIIFIYGCSTVSIPVYLSDKKPCTERFYSGHANVLDAAKQTLVDLGWVIEKEVEPQVYEIDMVFPEEGEAVLLVTGVRKTRLLLGTRYGRMNVYVRTYQDITEMEVRHFVIADWGIFKRKSFGDKRLASCFFEHVRNYLR